MFSSFISLSWIVNCICSSKFHHRTHDHTSTKMRRENSFVSINEVAIKTRWFCSSSFGCESILILGNGCECTIKKPTDCVFGLFGILICEPVFSSRLLFRCFFVIIINSESNSSTNWDHFGWSDKSANIAWAWWHRAMQSHREKKKNTHTQHSYLAKKSQDWAFFTKETHSLIIGLFLWAFVCNRNDGKKKRENRQEKESAKNISETKEDCRKWITKASHSSQYNWIKKRMKRALHSRYPVYFSLKTIFARIILRCESNRCFRSLSPMNECVFDFTSFFFFFFLFIPLPFGQRLLNTECRQEWKRYL